MLWPKIVITTAACWLEGAAFSTVLMVSSLLYEMALVKQCCCVAQAVHLVHS